MAAEDIGSLYNTKIPGFEDAADIQAALKLFLYGSLAYDTANTDPEQIPNPSLAHHLQTLTDEVDTIQLTGIGSSYVATEPTLPPEGYIWVDAASIGTGEVIYSTVVYSNTAPTTNLVDGTVWVDKSSATKIFYVWDAALNTWVRVNELASIVQAKGDLIVGNASGVAVKLPVGVNGSYLVADSTSTTGVSWQPQSLLSQSIENIMGVY